ncbi:hypothetical protein MC885_006977 [Smutsia gigantea]|nr:hypothetical protein MC885_006977 [Smutsia gigantea]
MARASSRPSQARARRRGRGRGCAAPIPTPGAGGEPSALAARRGQSWQLRADAPDRPAASGRLPLQPAARPARSRPGPGGQVFHVSIAFASQRPRRQVGAAANA